MPRRRKSSNVRFEFETVDNASDGIDDIGDGLERVGGPDGKSGLIGGVSTGMLALAGAAAAGGAAVAANAARWVQQTGQIAKSSAAINVNVKEYSALHHAFQQFNYDAVDLDAILRELEIKTYDWRDANQGVTAAFEELGLELESFDRLKPDEKLDAVARALANVESNSRRIGIADTIFGGDDAGKILNIADSLDRLTDEAERFGVTVDQDTADAVRAFQQNINTFETFLEGAADRVAQSTVAFAAPIVEHFGRVLGILPTEVTTAVNKVSTTIRDEGGRIVFQAGVVGQEAGLNLAQRFIRQAEAALSAWSFEDALARGQAEIEGAIAAEERQREGRDFLLRSGLFVPSLDGPAPRRGANILGSGVDDLTRGLTSSWVARLRAESGVPQFTPPVGDLSGLPGPPGGLNYDDLFPDDDDDDPIIPPYGGSYPRGGGDAGGSAGGRGDQIINITNNWYVNVPDEDSIISSVQEAWDSRRLEFIEAVRSGCIE